MSKGDTEKSVRGCLWMSSLRILERLRVYSCLWLFTGGYRVGETSHFLFFLRDIQLVMNGAIVGNGHYYKDTDGVSVLQEYGACQGLPL